MREPVWAEGDAYETYVGRWSRRVAAAFVPRTRVPPGRAWADVGCGTGALTEAVLTLADPASVVGVDLSEGFLTTARARLAGHRAEFRIGDARSLPLPDGGFDAVVSGLALNFVPGPARAVAELARVAAPGGVVAAYVWDYAGGMAMMRHLWAAATELDPAAEHWDERSRFAAVCRPAALAGLWTGAGLEAVDVGTIEIDTVFRGFDDFWQPFLGGQGQAPTYVTALSAPARRALRDLLRSRLPIAADGTIALTATALTVRGRRPVG